MGALFLTGDSLANNIISPGVSSVQQYMEQLNKKKSQKEANNDHNVEASGALILEGDY